MGSMEDIMIEQLEAEIEQLKAEIARKDDVFRATMAERSEFLDKFSEEKAREAARLAFERARDVVLAPGEYAILEFGYVDPDMLDAIREGLPEDVAGRVMVVDGQVHTLKPE